MTKEELNKILKSHKDWLSDPNKGILVDLRGVDLQGASLRGASLQGAYLQGADLRGAYLQGADLQGADLRGAYLQGAKLDSIIVNYETAGYFMVCPAKGKFIGWKKVEGKILKLLIPSNAKRSSATTRKCRAEIVEVIGGIGPCEILRTGVKGNEAKYEIGRTIHCHEWDPDRWAECSGGIHFFLTRQEAEQW